jgi:predicted P-loop ATPase/GTPase
MPKCQPNADVVIGDARLTVSKELAGGFGYLVIDAFSSDSIPVHLMTAEAIRMLTSKLDANGVMALHISNRHLDLAPALASTIALMPELTAVLVDDVTPAAGSVNFASRVVFVAKSKQALAAIGKWPDATPLTTNGAAPWTDDYSGVLAAMLRKLW